MSYAHLMRLGEKLKGFWTNGSWPWRWLKRVVAILLLWPLLSAVIFRFVPVPVSNLMLMRLPAGNGIQKTWKPLAHISPQLSRAVIAAEDQRFCAHHGVDWTELHDALANEDGPRRGASTLTMQVAKNLYLWEGRSTLRKALEIPLASYLDLVLGKRRLMEIYLNIAEWGPGIYGAEAAAQYHFGKSAARLNQHESALLAASLPSPLQREAGEPSRGVRALAAHIQGAMAGMDAYITCLD